MTLKYPYMGYGCANSTTTPKTYFENNIIMLFMIRAHNLRNQLNTVSSGSLNKLIKYSRRDFGKPAVT